MSRSDSPTPRPLQIDAIDSNSNRSRSLRRQQAATPPPVLHAFIGRKYLIVKELGRGAQGIAYLASVRQYHQPGSQQQQPEHVVIKKLRLRATGSPSDEMEVDVYGRPAVIQQHQHQQQHRDSPPPPDIVMTDAAVLKVHEVQTLAMLRHPHVLRFREAWWESSDGHLHISTEYCPGGTLLRFAKHLFKRAGSRFIPESWIWKWLHQCLAGTSFFHTHRVIHRDLNLNNIFLLQPASAYAAELDLSTVDPPSIRIGDFGLAKLMLSGDQHASSSCGSVAFWSPEIARGERYSYASDVFGLGGIFFFLMTRTLPFRGGQDQQGTGLDLTMLNSICCDEPVFSEDARARYSPELQQLVMSMLTKNCKERPTAAELLESDCFVQQLQRPRDQQPRHLVRSPTPQPPPPPPPSFSQMQQQFPRRMMLLKFYVPRAGMSSNKKKLTLTVNVRSRPSTEASCVGKLEWGDTVVATSAVRGEDGVSAWYRFVEPVDGFSIVALNGKGLFGTVVSDTTLIDQFVEPSPRPRHHAEIPSRGTSPMPRPVE